jgi:hypothetical protein
MLIIPAHMQVFMQVLSSAGWPFTVSTGEPGVHGETTAGMHGCGVSTPRAAAVAAATWGLAGDMHIPKDAMLAIGAKSMIEPTGMSLHVTVGLAVAVNVPGAGLIVQASMAPVTTSCGIPKA